MIDDRIGTIGSTQGVKLKSRPSTKKIGSTVISDRDLNAVSMRPASVDVADGEAADGKPADRGRLPTRSGAERPIGLYALSGG